MNLILIGSILFVFSIISYFFKVYYHFSYHLDSKKSIILSYLLGMLPFTYSNNPKGNLYLYIFFVGILLTLIFILIGSKILMNTE